jgi:hypothetical protein
MTEGTTGARVDAVTEAATSGSSPSDGPASGA